MKYFLTFDMEGFNRSLVAEHKKLLRNSFGKNIGKLEKAVKSKFSAKIKTSSEYRSLVSPRGALKLDLGLGENGDGEGMLNPSKAMAEIIDLLLADVVVSITDRKEGTDFIIGVTIKLLNDINSILQSDAGRYISINKKGEHNEVPWLEWLLTGGSSSVIIGYHVAYRESDSSRTGYAIMGKGSSFSIDSRFTGTKNDNFITRAAQLVMEEDVSDLIDKYLITPIGN